MATQEQIDEVRRKHNGLQKEYRLTAWIVEAPWGLGVRFYPEGEDHEGMVDTTVDGDVVLIEQL